jgi:hypothetical protein
MLGLRDGNAEGWILMIENTFDEANEFEGQRCV